MLGLLIRIGCDRPAVPFDRLIVVLEPEIGVRLVRVPVIEKRIVGAQPNGLVEKFKALLIVANSGVGDAKAVIGFGCGGLQRQCALVFCNRLVEARSGHEDGGLEDVAVRAVRIERERARHQFIRSLQVGVGVGAAVAEDRQRELEGQHEQGAVIVRIERERLFAELKARFRLLAVGAAFPNRRGALQRQILRVAIGRGRSLETRGLGLGELNFHRARQMGDDLVLRLQQIGAGRVELLGPDMGAAVGVNELGVDPHLIAAGLHRAFQNVAHAQIFADGLGVDRLALEREGRVARDHEAVRDLCEAGGQLVGQRVGEVVLRRIAGKIGEGQRHDGKTCGRAGRDVRGDESGPVGGDIVPYAARGPGERDDRDGEKRAPRARFLAGRPGRGYRFCLCGNADIERIDPDRLGDVLEVGRAEIRDGEVKPPLHLPVGLLRHADRAGPCNSLEPRGDIDALAHEVAVALLDDVAEVDANAEFDPAVRRHARVALNHGGLDLDGAARGVDHAAELDESAVAGALDDAPVVHGEGRVDEVAAQRSQPGENPLLVRPREPAVTGHVRGEDCGELSNSRSLSSSSRRA